MFFLALRIKGTDEAMKIFARYDKLIEDINAFKKKYFNDWAVNVPKLIEKKTNNMILARHGSDLILNFDPLVSKDEVVYMSIIKKIGYLTF